MNSVFKEYIVEHDKSLINSSYYYTVQKLPGCIGGNLNKATSSRMDTRYKLIHI